MLGLAPPANDAQKVDDSDSIQILCASRKMEWAARRGYGHRHCDCDVESVARSRPPARLRRLSKQISHTSLAATP